MWWSGARRVAKALWKLIIRAEVSKTYPDRMIGIVWNGLPERVRASRPTRAIGRLVHRRVCRTQARLPASYYTRFFRNTPQLELLRDVVLERPVTVPVRIVSLGCSSGAELYSALWMIRSARPEQPIRALGLDISESQLQKAVAGEYPLGSKEVAGISPTAYERLFTPVRDTLRIQDWLKEGVTWQVGDVCSPDLATSLGPHDVVLANNFLFHMPPERSASCLKNIARLLAPDGYLFIWGVDRNVRIQVVRELGLTPVCSRLKEIYTADPSALEAWPLLYWGAEPMTRRRKDWPIHYATVFKLTSSAQM